MAKVQPTATKRILIADDTASSRALLCEILRASGYAVTEAADTEQLLALAESFDPHLVILDLQMKELDAYATAAALHETKALPLLGLAAAATQAAPEEIAQAGISAYLVKPVNPSRLRSCVLGLLATRK